MIEVSENIFIGNDRDCFFDERTDWAVIHACKHTCHQKAVGYRGNLPSNHPNYLTFEKGNHLFLNIIDPEKPYFKPQLFSESISFIEKHIKKRKVLIHCNRGFSRAPSIALLWLAKRTNRIPDDGYQIAFAEFRKIFPMYRPSRGIVIYLSTQWKEFS